MTSILALDPPGVLLIEPRRFRDSRGVLSETFRAEVLAEAGYRRPFVQENVSISERRGTVRGLHFQAPPYAHDKLVRVARGAILDVAIDVRQGSPSYGLSVAVELTADNWRQLLIPRGFAHGFCTLLDNTQVVYKLSGYYQPAAEGGLLWSDPALRIDWPVCAAEAVVSDKDAVLPRLVEFHSPFVFGDPD